MIDVLNIKKNYDNKSKLTNIHFDGKDTRFYYDSSRTAGMFSSMPENKELNELLKIEASKIDADAVIDIMYEKFTDLLGYGKRAKGKAIKYIIEDEKNKNYI